MSWILLAAGTLRSIFVPKLEKPPSNEDLPAAGGSVGHADLADAPGVVEPEVRQERR